MMQPLWQHVLLGFLLLESSAQGKLVNVTIDDQSPSLFYSPDNGWTNSLLQCTGCTAHPNASRAIDGTWHDSTHDADVEGQVSPNQIYNVSTSFNGTAIYVKCILAETTSSPDGDSDMSFYIDDNLVGQFTKAAPGNPVYDYNVTVYSNTSIPAGQHRFTLQNGHVGGIKSLALFDAFVYSYDDGQLDHNQTGPTTDTGMPSKGPNVSAIVGFSVAGSLVLVLGIFTFLLFRLRRRQRLKSNTESTAEVPGNNQTVHSDSAIMPFLLGGHHTQSSITAASSINRCGSRHTKITQSQCKDRSITQASHLAAGPSEYGEAPPSYY
ncbi:uncharacterized protein BT62DRAFT_1074813 [Guyanagaster necrorhizus]|uniref:Uncharacterized protein n=1 Tax=Guyanagaster necrorhizus TaxID=856835 RepID=A0A9P7VWR9_9AGAR|nr:uncharacterized protein BT62DRAFT_1074813 [Guyanagaster necrorhizus MCA 3950]KAG7448337.1 hypothetical protein BT62DRAFT_1074813 [Guyanagaster necrorhizus MCA 3950]